MTNQPLAYPLWRLDMFDSTDREAIIADDALFSTTDGVGLCALLAFWLTSA